MAAQWPEYACIAVVFAGLDFAVMVAYALIGARAMRLLRRNAVLWLDRSCGGALLALAGSLAFCPRSAADAGLPRGLKASNTPFRHACCWPVPLPFGARHAPA